MLHTWGLACNANLVWSMYGGVVFIYWEHNIIYTPEATETEHTWEITLLRLYSLCLPRTDNIYIYIVFMECYGRPFLIQCDIRCAHSQFLVILALGSHFA